MISSKTASDNSIQDCNLSNSKINEIKLLFNSSKLEGKTLIITEGNTDKVYKNFFNPLKVVIKPNNSCDGLTRLVDELNTEYRNLFIVIKDADFDYLNKISYDKYENFFITDSHDIETMMLSEKDIEKRLAIEFLDIDSKGFIDKCIKDIEPISYFKWFNMYNHLNLFFKDFKIGNVYNGRDKVLYKSCEKELMKNKKNENLCSNLEERVISFYEMNNTNDKWNLVNGHDLCTAINIYIGSQNRSGGDIHRCIRMAYSFCYFKKTKLYKSILEWECLHNKKILEK